MSQSYSGDPSTSDLDYYRFLIGDTGELDEYDSTPAATYILSDEEINFVISRYKYENAILYVLYDSMASVLSRWIKNSLGPAAEDPTTRLKYYTDKAKEYRKLNTAASGLSLPVYASEKSFWKGIHDND